MRHKFRHLLERHNLGDRLFARIAEYLQESGLKVTTGTIMGATTISAPSSTKNKDRKRDPERYQTRKGNRHQALTDTERAKNRSKSRVRAKVEHPFLILKRVFGFNKLRCRGLDKNANRLFVACGLVNLYMARRRLLRVT